MVGAEGSPAPTELAVRRRHVINEQVAVEWEMPWMKREAGRGGEQDVESRLLSSVGGALCGREGAWQRTSRQPGQEGPWPACPCRLQRTPVGQAGWVTSPGGGQSTGDYVAG